MKARDQDYKVLAYLQNDATRTAPEVARALKMRPESVRHSLATLTEHGSIRKIALISCEALGFSEYTLYLSLRPTEDSVRDAFLTFLRRHECVARIEIVGGEFEYMIAFLARSARQVAAFFVTIGSYFHDLIQRKQIGVQLSFTSFGRKYLGLRTVGPIIHLPMATVPCSIDILDHKILMGLSRQECPSQRDIAAKLDTSSSLVSQRIEKLNAHGIVGGFVYGIKPKTLGRTTYRILVQACAVTKEFHDVLYSWANKHPEIVHVVHLLGEWDYSLQAEVAVGADVVAITRELQSKLPGHIQRVSTVPLFGLEKNVNYPFQSFPLSI